MQQVPAAGAIHVMPMGSMGGSGGVGAPGSTDTRSIRARMLLADQLTRDGDLNQAASVYAQVAESYAGSGRVPEAVAVAQRSQGLAPAWFTVKTVASLLDKLRTDAVPICTRAAESHWRGGRVTEALQFYYQATQLDPSDAPALIRLAQAYKHQTLYKEATATFVVASRRLLEQQNNADFIAVAEQILRIDGGHAETLRELAKAYLRVGEPRRAVAKLTALMQVVPEDPAGYEILAQAFACIGKEDVAVSVLTRLTDDLRDQGFDDEAGDLLWRASLWLPDNLAFQRKVASLANNEIPTTVTSDEDPPPLTRDGVMRLGRDDIGQLDENSGVYRDREGTSVLSLDDIAVMEDLAQTRLREDSNHTLDTRADGPPPMPPKRGARPHSSEEPPTRVMGEDPPTRVVDDAVARAPAFSDDQPTLVPPSRTKAPPPTGGRRKPILTKHEGTIVLDLRDLAVVGQSREESVVLDISDVSDEPQYSLPDLIVDEESVEIELEPTDLHTIRKKMPAPPPLATAIRPQKMPKSPTVPVKVARPALRPISRSAGAVNEDAPTTPPGIMMGKPRLEPEDLDDEQPTTMMAVDAGDVVKDLFKKKRTGRDRSASLLDKLGPKSARAGKKSAAKRAEAAKPTAKKVTARRTRKTTGVEKTTQPRGNHRRAAVTTTAPQKVVPQAPVDVAPAVTGDTHVGAAPTDPNAAPRRTAKSGTRSGGVRWRKPTAPKRDKPK